MLDGNAVVLFAYGLSGSGKTFTVFGPDDPAELGLSMQNQQICGVFSPIWLTKSFKKKDGWKDLDEIFSEMWLTLFAT